VDQALHTPEAIANKTERNELASLLEAHRLSEAEGEMQARRILGITSFQVQVPAPYQGKDFPAAHQPGRLSKQAAKEALQRLYKAVEGKSAEEVGKALEETPQLDINESRATGKNAVEGTVLHVASRKNLSEVVEILLGHAGVNVNQRNTYGSTALLMACLTNSVAVVKILVAHPQVDVNIADKDGGSPLWWAAYKGHLEVVELLLASNKEVHLEVLTGCARVTKTPEQMAGDSGHSEIEGLLRCYRQDRVKATRDLRDKRKKSSDEGKPEERKHLKSEDVEMQ